MCYIQLSSFSSLALVVQAGHVDRTRYVTWQSPTDQTICSEAFEPNGMKVHLEVKRKQKLRKNFTGFSMGHQVHCWAFEPNNIKVQLQGARVARLQHGCFLQRSLTPFLFLPTSKLPSPSPSPPPIARLQCCSDNRKATKKNENLFGILSPSLRYPLTQNACIHCHEQGTKLSE